MAGSVCPHSFVITRSWTDVHSSLLKAGAIHGASPYTLFFLGLRSNSSQRGPRGDVEQALIPVRGIGLTT